VKQQCTSSIRRTPSDSLHPFSDRVVRLIHAIVRAAVDSGRGFALRCFGRVDLACRLTEMDIPRS
jgi:hypothetical protein